MQYGLGYLPLYVARDAGLFDKHMKAQGLEPVPVRIVNFTGGPQIQDGLLSQTLDIGAGGVTVLLIARDKTRGAGDQAMLGLTALSSVPYDLWTVDANLKLGLPAEFLIGPDGRVLAVKYGRVVDDHWPVDELLSLARPR